MYNAYIEENSIIIKEGADEVFNLGAYGSLDGDNLFLETYEAMNLLDREKIRIIEEEEELSKEEFYKRACQMNDNFPHIYLVYQDLRKRGYLVRPGMNFPADLRVYERGTSYSKEKKLKHVKWLLDVVRTNKEFSLARTAKKIKSAKNIRAQLALGIVDEEGDVTYYQLNEEEKLNEDGTIDNNYSDVEVEGHLYDDLIIIWRDKEKIYEAGYFGKLKENRLELNLLEGVYLAGLGILNVYQDGNKIDYEELEEIAIKKNVEFKEKYAIYEDLRDKGFLVRAGFKFGTHFRLYDRGVKLKKGTKKPNEHTKWVVHAVSENLSWSYPELSRFVRLALNIRSKPTLAVVNDAKKYYRMVRIKP